MEVNTKSKKAELTWPQQLELDDAKERNRVYPYIISDNEVSNNPATVGLFSNFMNFIKNTNREKEFRAWFKPCKPRGVKDNELYILAPSSFWADYVNYNYNFLIESFCKKNNLVDINFIPCKKQAL